MFFCIKSIFVLFFIGITWHPPNLPGHKVFETGEGLPAIYVRVSTTYTLGVKVRHLKVEFKTGGAWCWVGQ